MVKGDKVKMENMENIINHLERNILLSNGVNLLENEREVRIFVAAYIQGIEDQRKEDFCNFTKEDKEIIEEWTKNYLIKPFYVTFGSSKDHAFKNGFIVIPAESEKKALEIFHETYPGKGYAFIYNEDMWVTICSNGCHFKNGKAVI